LINPNDDPLKPELRLFDTNERYALPAVPPSASEYGYHFILCNWSLEYCTDSEALTLLKNAYDNLTIGGLLVIKVSLTTDH
jgi:predicted SAM-dependent methyltransferase